MQIGNTDKIRILLIEDDAEDAVLVRRALRRAEDFPCILTHVTCLNDALSTLKQVSHDVVLLDLSLPDATGMDTVNGIRRVALDIPCVILSGLEDRELAIHALKLGVQDYLIKDTINSRMLSRVISYAMERSRLAKVLMQQNEQLKELDRMKSEFVSVVSHELRTPITAIKSAIGLVEDGTLGPLNNDQQEYITLVQRNVDRLTGLIHDVLSISRIESGRLQVETDTEEIGKIIQEVVAIFAAKASERNCLLETDMKEQALFAKCDADKITQILVNLVENAMSHNPKRVHISIGAQKGKDRIFVWVKDNGKGIPEKEHEKIFERFYQVDRKHGGGRKGTGLGLAISNGLAEAHGGKLSLVSQPGQGATFSFDLPAVQIKTCQLDQSKTWELDALTLTIEKYGECIRFLMSGRLDEKNCADFWHVCHGILEDWGKLVAVDLSECLYINSRGIGSLVELHALALEQGGNMVLLNLSPKVRPVLDAIGLLQTIPAYHDLWAAFDALRKK